MAHPYISGSSGIAAAITQFRKAFPTKVNAETLKKYGIAPNNESYLINILRFLGVIDAEGARTVTGQAVFASHEDADFHKAFSDIVEASYSELFDLHKDASWTLPTSSLISFFRTADKSSDLVGRRQAATFQTLASFAGHGEIPTPKVPAKPKESKAKPGKEKTERPPAAVISQSHNSGAANSNNSGVGLTVRIEVNLPAAADQETYDRIFRSIRENLLNAK